MGIFPVQVFCHIENTNHVCSPWCKVDAGQPDQLNTFIVEWNEFTVNFWVKYLEQRKTHKILIGEIVIVHWWSVTGLSSRTVSILYIWQYVDSNISWSMFNLENIVCLNNRKVLLLKVSRESINPHCYFILLYATSRLT